MEGYDVITSENEKVGHVTSETELYAVVENGVIRHSRHVVPREFLHADEGEEVYRTTLSKEMIHGAPAAGSDGEFDEHEVASYYGIESAAPREGEARAAGEEESPFVDTRPDPRELAGGFEQERMVRGGL